MNYIRCISGKSFYTFSFLYTLWYVLDNNDRPSNYRKLANTSVSYDINLTNNYLYNIRKYPYKNLYTEMRLYSILFYRRHEYVIYHIFLVNKIIKLEIKI